MRSQSVTIQMKVGERYFPVVVLGVYTKHLKRVFVCSNWLLKLGIAFAIHPLSMFFYVHGRGAHLKNDNNIII